MSLYPSNPLLGWLLVLFVSLACGLLGGLGGRWLKTRSMFNAIWDQLSILDTRISRREGQASGEARKLKSELGGVTPAAAAALQDILAQAAGGRARGRTLPLQQQEETEAETVRRVFGEQKKA